MDQKKLERIRAMGGRVTTVEEFLGLTEQDMAIIRVRENLAEMLSVARKAAKLTQTEIAKRIGSSQSRIAKMESGDQHASFESMIKAINATGAGIVTVKMTSGAELAKELRARRLAGASRPKTKARTTQSKASASAARHA